MKVWMKYAVLVDLDIEELDIEDFPDWRGLENILDWEGRLKPLLAEAEKSALDALDTYALHAVDSEFRDWDFAE